MYVWDIRYVCMCVCCIRGWDEYRDACMYICTDQNYHTSMKYFMQYFKTLKNKCLSCNTYACTYTNSIFLFFSSFLIIPIIFQ